MSYPCMFLETQRGSVVVNLAGIGGMQNERSTAIWLRAAKPAGTHGDWWKRVRARASPASRVQQAQGEKSTRP